MMKKYKPRQFHEFIPTPAQIKYKKEEIQNNWANKQWKDRNAGPQVEGWTPPQCVEWEETNPDYF